jgi:hypothetical protein
LIEGTIVLRHRVTGKLAYTFDKWSRQEVDGQECLSTVANIPSQSETQVVDYIPVADLEVVK